MGPLLGGQCRFVPTCSHYALDALRTKPTWRALRLITWRLARCQPLGKPGFDFVPEEPSDEIYRLKTKTSDPCPECEKP